MAEATTSNNALHARKQAATPRGAAVAFDMYATRARNAELWDADGRRYLDFYSGIAVLNVGHCHPRVVAAVEQQLQHFTHTAWQVLPYESYIALAERLNALAPGAFAKKSVLFNSGAEAVENAIKIARAATGRPGVIAFGGGFHGRTLMGLALTGKVAPYKLQFGPFPADVYHAPFPCALHGVSSAQSLAGIQHLLRTEIDPKRVAAIVFEPVQGEGGFYAAPPEWVQALRALCDEHGMLLIADEIQTGFGRTGKLFAMEHHRAHADLITVAKSLAGGLPLSGVIGRAEVMDAVEPGGLGGTYAGNALAVAAAHAVLDIFASDHLLARSQALGAQLMTHLHALQTRVPALKEVRGLGSMVAVEFMDAQGNPDAAFAKRVQQACRERGLLILTCGVYGNVIRFLYPLTIEDALFAEALNMFSAAVEAAMRPE